VCIGKSFLKLTVITCLADCGLYYFAFIRLTRLAGESASLAKELGIRLGQASEFSLLVAYSAFTAGKIEARTSYLIQLATISTFIISTYFVVYKYPTPNTVNKFKRQD